MSAMAELTTPATSRVRRCGWSMVGMAHAPRASVAIPTGTLMKKIQCQLACCERRPPSSGPMASARAPTALQAPTAAACSLGAGKLVVRMASVVGVSSAAPTP